MDTFPGDKQVEKYIALYNNDYPKINENSDIIFNKIIEINESRLKEDSIWYRKSNYFTLLCELIWHNSELIKILDKLENFENEVIKNKNQSISTNKFAAYYANMYTGTNSRNARVKRSEILKEYVNFN